MLCLGAVMVAALFVPVAGQAPLAYIRMHGRNAAAWWEHDTPDDRYNYLYSAAELAPIADKARAAIDRMIAIS